MAHRSLYVYYKVEARLGTAIQDRVLAMQRMLMQRYPGLDAQLLKREQAQEAGDHETWMEVYRHSQGVAPDMEQAVAQAARPIFEQGAEGVSARHVEVFIPCV